MAAELDAAVAGFRSRPLDQGPSLPVGAACRARRPRTAPGGWPFFRDLTAVSDRVLDTLTDKLPTVTEHLDAARADVLASTDSPKEGVAPDLAAVFAAGSASGRRDSPT
jgi:hypothetical protein